MINVWRRGKHIKFSNASMGEGGICAIVIIKRDLRIHHKSPAGCMRWSFSNFLREKKDEFAVARGMKKKS